MPDIYTVELDGKRFDLQGDHPPTEEEARAAIGPIGDHYTGPDTFMGGALRSLGQTAADTATNIGKGALSAIDPRTYLNAARSKRDTEAAYGDRLHAGDLSGQHPAGASPDVSELGRTLTTPEGGGQAIGQLLTGLLLPRAVNKAGGMLRTIAPKAMDMGLQRTQADRLDFPNTPQRLVDERIIPHGTNVQEALSATEGKINSEARAFDQPNLIGPGAPLPPSPADPRAMAQTAQQFATKTGHVTGLGNVAGPEAAEIKSLGREYLDQNTRPRGLQETIAQKRAYQQRATYPNKPNAPESSNNAMNFNKGMAGANRAEAIRMNPALADDLAKEQDLIGADTAVQKMNAKSTPLSTGGMIKTGLLLRNPTVMGGAAIGMNELGRGMQSLPDLIQAALLAQMTAPHTEPTR